MTTQSFDRWDRRDVNEAAWPEETRHTDTSFNDSGDNGQIAAAAACPNCLHTRSCCLSQAPGS